MYRIVKETGIFAILLSQDGLKATVQKESPKEPFPKVTSEAAAYRCMFFKIGALRDFAIFTGKHLFWSLF